MKEIEIKDGSLYEEQFRFRERRNNAFFFFTLAILVLLFFTVYTCWTTAFDGIRVSGPSMEKTLQDGDRLLVQKTGWWHEADYGDVIIVQVDGYTEWQDRQTKYIIKRLIAKEGDAVRCLENGEVELKKAGESEYTLLKEPYAYYENNKASYSFQEYVVGKGEIFFLGDNRCNSQDSRYKEGKSQLTYLYKETDIYATVSEWSIDNRHKLDRIFFLA